MVLKWNTNPENSKKHKENSYFRMHITQWAGGWYFSKSYFRIFSFFYFTFKLEFDGAIKRKNYEKIFIRSDFTNIFITQKSEIFNQTFGRKYL